MDEPTAVPVEVASKNKFSS